jgi:hypothetical protein
VCPHPPEPSQYEKAAEDVVERHLLRWCQSELGLKVAHAESLRADLTPQQIEYMLTPEALTMSLLGLKQDDAVLGPERAQVPRLARPPSSGVATQSDTLLDEVL